MKKKFLKRIEKISKKITKAKKKGKINKAHKLKEKLKYLVKDITKPKVSRSFNVPQAEPTHYGSNSSSSDWSEEDSIRYKQAHVESQMYREQSGRESWDRQVYNRIFDRGSPC